MRIEEIHVDGFGLMHGRVVQPDAGLTVVRGMNEAGKTTLLSFIRTILFGFDGRSYRAMAGGRRGGWLKVRTRDGRGFRIERYGETGGLGRLRVLDEQDRDLGAGELAVLLQGVDGTLFRNVFAFGLAELAEFKKLTDDQVTARIYGAGLALGSVSPLEIEASLKEAREGLFKPGGHNPTINAFLRELEAIDDDLRKADLPATYEAAVLDLARHDTRLAELHDAIASAGDERRRAERLRDAWEPWLALQEATSVRTLLDGVRVLPPDLPERLSVLEARSEASRGQLDEVERRRSEQEIALARIDVDVAIVGCRTEVEDLARAAERDSARETELTTVADQIHAAERERDDALLRLGDGWTPERVAAFDDSVTVQTEIGGRFRERLDLTAAALTGARASRAQAGREFEAVTTEHARIAAEITEIAALEATGPDAGEQERAIAALDSALAERDRAARRAAAAMDEVRVAADSMPRTETSVAEDMRAARLLRESIQEAGQAAALLASLPVAAATGSQASSASLLGPILVGAAGVVVAFAALVAGVPILLAALIAVAGLLGAGAIWMMTRTRSAATTASGVRERLEARVVTLRAEAASHATRFGLTADASVAEVDAILEKCAVDERSLAKLGALRVAGEATTHELAQAEAALENLARAARLAGEPSAEALGELRSRLQAARDRRSRRLGLGEQAATLARRIEALERSLADAVRLVEEADAEDHAAREEWVGWLTAHDLDAGLDRETAKTVIDAVTTAKRPLRTLATLGERHETLLGAHEAFLDQAVAVAARAGWTRPRPTNRSSLDRLVADLESTLEGALEAEAAHDNATAALEGLVREVAQAREGAETADARLSAVLAEHGAEDLAVLRIAIGRSDEARAQDDLIAECRRTLTALSGPGAAFDALLGELEAIAELDAISVRLDGVCDRLATFEDEQGRLREEAGALRDQIATMERDVAATELRQRREDLLGRLTDAAEQWSVAALARHLLHGSRETYEAAHRPAVIETAERYFAEWTAGRYSRIIAPLGRQIEAVEHRDGTQVAIGDLSTGTAQQLYLAVRFGLVEHFSEAAEPLPIVMDDILVNFDDERAALAARSIECLAQRHQVIYFTCHPETPLVGGLHLQLDRLETVQQAVTVQ